MIASPAASTGARSGFSAASASRSTWPQPIIRLRSRARPSGVMPAADSPFCSRISASASAVPDDAYAALQCSRLNSFAITSISARATVSAAANAVAVSRPLREEALGEPDAADLQRFELLRREAAADDELGRAAADVDDEARLGRGRQDVGDAVVDEPRFLVAGDDVDREAERALGLRQEVGRVGREAERVRRDGAHGRRMQPPDALAEAREAGDRGAPRLGREAAAGVETGADAQRLAPRVEPVDLVALDATDLEPKAVRAHVDDGERGGGERRARHGGGSVADSNATGKAEAGLRTPGCTAGARKAPRKARSGQRPESRARNHGV